MAADRRESYRERVALSDETVSEIERRLHVGRYEFAAGLPLGQALLDCACGTGYGTAILARDGSRRLLGVDISAEAVEYARAHVVLPGVEFLAADACRPQSLGGPFDAVVSFETIEHVPDAGALLRSFGAVLRPGGLLVISTPNGGITSPLRKLRPANRHHMWEDDVPGFKARLSEAGYRVQESYGQAYLSPRMRSLYRLARARGQLLARGILRPVEELALALERRLVRLLQGQVVGNESEALPTATHSPEHCVYQIHVCEWTGP